MTRKQAEAHLARLARRRERYAAKKKEKKPVVAGAQTPRQLALFEPPAPRTPTKKQQAEIDLIRRSIRQKLEGEP